jgi:hypothetical protein
VVKLAEGQVTAAESVTAAKSRPRRRLSRTFSRSRWSEYRQLLRLAMGLGYEVLSLERWLERSNESSVSTLILRHDVDQHPRSAMRMAAIEEDLGVRSTLYFRWRTADPRVIRALRRRGFEVGLHYETLTRTLLERGQSGTADGAEALLHECRQVLGQELAEFARRHGPCRSACPHGDSRVPGISNAVLLQDVDPTDFGLRWDGNEAMRGRSLDLWLTDRSAAEGRWRDELDPATFLYDRCPKILCLTHPNNWASGPSLWDDRVVSALIPQALPWPVRTRSDAPPTSP